MAEGQRSDAGGIRGLLELIDQHREAIEYDLIDHGLRLAWVGTPDLSWRDLWVIVRQSPRGSALHRSQAPDEWDWGLPEHLFARAIDELRVANWQRSPAKPEDYPWPIPRPGIEPQEKTHGTNAVSMDEMRAWLGWDKTT